MDPIRQPGCVSKVLFILPHQEPDRSGKYAGVNERAEHAPETAKAGERVDVVGVFRVQVITVHLAPRGDRAG
jgi:hypothetical protein